MTAFVNALVRAEVWKNPQHPLRSYFDRFFGVPLVDFYPQEIVGRKSERIKRSTARLIVLMQVWIKLEQWNVFGHRSMLDFRHSFYHLLDRPASDLSRTLDDGFYRAPEQMELVKEYFRRYGQEVELASIIPKGRFNEVAHHHILFPWFRILPLFIPVAAGAYLDNKLGVGFLGISAIRILHERWQLRSPGIVRQRLFDSMRGCADSWSHFR